MERIVAYCGIICSNCPTLIATKKDDDTIRKRIAEMLTKQYGRECKPEDINCDGCLGDSPRLWHYCGTCDTRNCAIEKNVKNCACCPEYPCQKLSELIAAHTKAKETWDEIRRTSC